MVIFCICQVRGSVLKKQTHLKAYLLRVGCKINNSLLQLIYRPQAFKRLRVANSFNTNHYRFAQVFTALQAVLSEPKQF